MKKFCKDGVAGACVSRWKGGGAEGKVPEKGGAENEVLQKGSAGGETPCKKKPPPRWRGGGWGWGNSQPPQGGWRFPNYHRRQEQNNTLTVLVRLGAGSLPGVGQ